MSPPGNLPIAVPIHRIIGLCACYAMRTTNRDQTNECNKKSAELPLADQSLIHWTCNLLSFNSNRKALGSVIGILQVKSEQM
jgi:hypothetical protein